MSTATRGRPRQNILVIDTEAKRIGSLLKYLREERGVTQSRISERVGVSQATYAQYESGAKRIPTYSRLVEIVHKLDALAKDGSPRMPDPECIALPELEVIAA